MRRWIGAAVVTVALTGCFTRPELRARDDAGIDDGGVDDGANDDAPIDAACLPAVDPPVPQHQRLQFDHVSAGYFHACAIDTSGELWCWGSNDHMQLGDRTDAPGAMTGVPGKVSPTITGWDAVSASADHSCGIANDKVYCWGRNDAHQSIPGGTGDDIFPTEVSFSGVSLMPSEVPAKVFAGPTMSCAITNLNRAICWGDLDLTAGSAGPGPQLVVAPGTPTWSTMAIAEDHACAISVAGHLYCWGENDAFQLGTSTPATRTFAEIAERDLTAMFTSVAVARDVTCATRIDGDLVCFGSAGSGHLGNVGGTYIDREVVDGGTNRISLGANHACYATTANTVHCHGDSTDGAIGAGAFQGNRTPAQAAVASNIVELVAGEGFSCALDAAKNLTCWGQNAHGELGLGVIATKRAPSLSRLPIGTCESVLQVASGDRHTCALVGVASEGGRLYCWGNNTRRQVTSTTNELSIPRPALVFAGESFSRISAGEMHTCAVRLDGTIRCWGDNSSGQLGVASTSSATIAPINGMPWTYVAAGSRSTCAIRQSGELYCWGNVPTAGLRATPTNFGRPQQGGTKNWSTISLGSGFGIGTAIDPALANRVFVYGFAPTGCQVSQAQTGPGAIITDPHLLYDLEHVRANVTAAQANGGHACIHMNVANGTNKITCFGENGSNQCSPNQPTGDSCVLYEDVMAPPDGWRMAFPGVSTVTASRTHTCALDASGRPRCWGANNASELGSLPNANPTPTEVTDQRYAEISTGADHTCGISDTRTSVACWGENRYGQLGDDAQFHATPTPAGLVPL